MEDVAPEKPAENGEVPVDFPPQPIQRYVPILESNSDVPVSQSSWKQQGNLEQDVSTSGTK